jgi:sulfite exporter TauE/SafE
MHGMAGSAALVVLTASTFESPLWGLAYILAFGLGTTLGMGAFSAIIAAPITLTAKSMTLVNRTLQGAIGVFTCAIGIAVLIDNAEAIWPAI